MKFFLQGVDETTLCRDRFVLIVARSFDVKIRGILSNDNWWRYVIRKLSYKFEYTYLFVCIMPLLEIVTLYM